MYYYILHITNPHRPMWQIFSQMEYTVAIVETKNKLSLRMKKALLLTILFPLVKGSVRVLAPSKARNRPTAWSLLNMHRGTTFEPYMRSSCLFSRFRMVYIYNKSCAIFSFTCGSWKYSRTLMQNLAVMPTHPSNNINVSIFGITSVQKR